jgi:poly-gamma-glutamate capsule biosynthesis protein CapA/YwtB (metallophosphatase superfamily)
MFLRHRFTLEHPLPEHYVFNLEAPLTAAVRGYPGKINLRGVGQHFDATFPHPPVAVCLANNHIMDFGEEGFRDTLRFLEARGIAYFGAGYAAENCNNPLVLQVGDTQVGLLGYAEPLASPVFAAGEQPGCARNDLARIAEDIAEARRRGATRVIVHLHWGAEQVAVPRRQDVVLGRAVLDAGADLLIGHHAHCIQSYEVYEGKHLFYGLGNWMFPPHTSPAYYGPDGQPTRQHVSRSFPKNQRSLAVAFDLETGEVSVVPQHFDGHTLRRGTFSPSRYRLEIGDLAAHDARFKRAYRLGKLEHALRSYLAAPKAPRWRHVTGVARMLRQSQK